MKPLSTEQLRAAAHRKVDAADEPTLISMLEVGPNADSRSGYRYTAQQLAELQEASEAYKRGALQTLTEEAFWESINQQTHYSRLRRDEA